jgi:uncharacterized protein YcnI
VRLAPAAAAALILMSAPAAAHVVARPSQAPAGSDQTVSFFIEHGCNGSPTVRVRVRLPEGVENAKARPKEGWKDSASRSNAASTRVDEVIWLGGKLDANKGDEFAVALRLPDTPGKTIYFPVVQECEKGVNRWIEIPGPNLPATMLKYSAPLLVLT